MESAKEDLYCGVCLSRENTKERPLTTIIGDNTSVHEGCYDVTRMSCVTEESAGSLMNQCIYCNRNFSIGDIITKNSSITAALVAHVFCHKYYSATKRINNSQSGDDDDNTTKSIPTLMCAICNHKSKATFLANCSEPRCGKVLHPFCGAKSATSCFEENDTYTLVKCNLHYAKNDCIRKYIAVIPPKLSPSVVGKSHWLSRCESYYKRRKKSEFTKFKTMVPTLFKMIHQEEYYDNAQQQLITLYCQNHHEITKPEDAYLVSNADYENRFTSTTTNSVSRRSSNSTTNKKKNSEGAKLFTNQKLCCIECKDEKNPSCHTLVDTSNLQKVLPNNTSSNNNNTSSSNNALKIINPKSNCPTFPSIHDIEDPTEFLEWINTYIVMSPSNNTGDVAADNTATSNKVPTVVVSSLTNGGGGPVLNTTTKSTDAATISTVVNTKETVVNGKETAISNDKKVTSSTAMETTVESSDKDTSNNNISMDVVVNDSATNNNMETTVVVNNTENATVVKSSNNNDTCTVKHEFACTTTTTNSLTSEYAFKRLDTINRLSNALNSTITTTLLLPYVAYQVKRIITCLKRSKGPGITMLATLERDLCRLVTDRLMYDAEMVEEAKLIEAEEAEAEKKRAEAEATEKAAELLLKQTQAQMKKRKSTSVKKEPVKKKLKQAQKTKQQTPKRESEARLHRCNTCVGCLAPDCKACPHCLDKIKYGGTGKRRRACVNRKCVALKPSSTPSSSVVPSGLENVIALPSIIEKKNDIPVIKTEPNSTATNPLLPVVVGTPCVTEKNKLGIKIEEEKKEASVADKIVETKVQPLVGNSAPNDG